MPLSPGTRAQWRAWRERRHTGKRSASGNRKTSYMTTCRDHVLAWTAIVALAALAAAPTVAAQSSSDPFPTPINATDNIIAVNVAEFATIPDIAGEAPRMMLLVDEPGTRRLFVNDMRGPLYSVSYDGKTVAQYLDVNDPEVGRARAIATSRTRRAELRVPSAVQPARARRLRQVLHVHRHEQHHAEAGLRAARPAGARTTPCCSSGPRKIPQAATYDGGGPRELFRAQQPFPNHNGGHDRVQPARDAGDSPEFGLLYVGSRMAAAAAIRSTMRRTSGRRSARSCASIRSATNSANGKYGIPPSNPFVEGKAEALGEIYAYGVRNPQRFSWDPKTGAMYRRRHRPEHRRRDQPGDGRARTSDGTSGRAASGTTRAGRHRRIDGGDPKMTYPIVEFDHKDPLLHRQRAVTGVVRLSRHRDCAAHRTN